MGFWSGWDAQSETEGYFVSGPVTRIKVPKVVLSDSCPGPADVHVNVAAVSEEERALRRFVTESTDDNGPPFFMVS